MKNTVPFVPNTSDGVHCVPAVFRMINKYYFNEDLNWEEIDKIMKVIPGKGTWTFPGLTALSKKGLRITHIEPLDYEKLQKKGPEYLRKMFGKDTADYYINKSNISLVLKYVPDYLKSVNQINRESSIEEIIKYLKDGFLVTVEINSRILNNKEGLSLHYILLYDFDGKYITLHDPGLPPIEGRKITPEDLDKAFNYPGSNKTITAFKSGKQKAKRYY